MPQTKYMHCIMISFILSASLLAPLTHASKLYKYSVNDSISSKPEVKTVSTSRVKKFAMGNYVGGYTRDTEHPAAMQKNTAGVMVNLRLR